MYGSWQDIRKDATVLEDQYILVINKPAGIAVVGDSNGNDLVNLAKNDGEKLRPVHRIDKETSGIVVFAKSPQVHAQLTRQFNKRSVDKFYLAVVKSANLPEEASINLPLSLGRKDRVRVAAQRSDIVFNQTKNCWEVPSDKLLKDVKLYPSQTFFNKLWSDGNYALLLIRPITGRKHQIRVHLAWIGSPILGDPLFNKEDFSRTYLHSFKLSFNKSWNSGDTIKVEAPPPDDFWKLLPGNLPPKFFNYPRK